MKDIFSSGYLQRSVENFLDNRDNINAFKNMSEAWGFLRPVMFPYDVPYVPKYHISRQYIITWYHRRYIRRVLKTETKKELYIIIQHEREFLYDVLEIPDYSFAGCHFFTDLKNKLLKEKIEDVFNLSV